MAPALHQAAVRGPSTRWSLAAGATLYLAGTAVAYLMDEIVVLFGEVVGIPAPYSLLGLGTPALVAGAVSWWRIVERPAAYTYTRGVLVGFTTAFVTAAVWVGRFVAVWGGDLLAAPPVALIAGLVVAVGLTGGVLVSLPLMYARRRVGTADAMRSGPAT